MNKQSTQRKEKARKNRRKVNIIREGGEARDRLSWHPDLVSGFTVIELGDLRQVTSPFSVSFLICSEPIGCFGLDNPCLACKKVGL